MAVEVEPTRAEDEALPPPERPPRPAGPDAAGYRCLATLPRGEAALAWERKGAPEAAELYARGLTAIDESRLDEAMDLLLRLTENHKTSKLIPYAYLQFGELFFAQAEKTPDKLPVALNFYREVAKYEVHEEPYVRLRTAEVHERSGQHTEALQQYTRAAEALQGWQDPCHRALSIEVKAGLDRTFGRVGDPAKRCAFFARVLPHRACP